MLRKERLEEEFESESEEQAFKDYLGVTNIISVNYSLIADELSCLGDFQEGLAIDIGTGLGDLAIEIARRYPKLKIIGVDISQTAITEAARRIEGQYLNEVSFQLGDVHSLPFSDLSVDLVVSHGAIHHLKDLSKVLFEIYRVLKPNALAYLSDLRRDAPEDIIRQVKMSLSASQAKAFLNSINASYIPEELRQVFDKLRIKDYSISDQKFSRDTISKNKYKLRSSSMRKADYTKLSQTIIIRK
jgi:ubiquinone/menaquinone biosynthesis C-methylase UbiE